MENELPAPEYSLEDLAAILEAMRTDEKVTLNIARAFSCLTQAILSLTAEFQIISDKVYELPEDY